MTINLLGYLLAFLLLQELLRRYQWLSWAVFALLPIILLPWWLRYSEQAALVWIKLYSLAAVTSWMNALRFTRLQHRKWAFVLLYLIGIVNFLEVIAQGIISGTAVDIMSAVTGMLLIITCPRPSTIQVADGPYRDLYWDTPLAWIVGYTIWNLVFIYDYSPQTVGSHAAILGAALLVALINRKRWMQARVITFVGLAILGFTYRPLFFPIGGPEQANEQWVLIGTIISLVWMLLYSGYYVFKLFMVRTQTTELQGQ